MNLRFFRQFHRGFDAAEPLHLPRVGQRTDPTAVTVRLAKFSDKQGPPHLHPHAFRHAAASTMIASGKVFCMAQYSSAALPQTCPEELSSSRSGIKKKP